MTLFRICLVATTFGLLTAACGGQHGQSAQQQADGMKDQLATADSLLLVPGRSAGPIHLGDADATLLEALGRPDFSDAAMGKAVLLWRLRTDTAEYPLSVFTSRDMGNDETARIQQIRITSPRFETPESIRVGSTLREISSAYSHTLTIVETYEENGDTYTIYDADEGIAFELDPANCWRGHHHSSGGRRNSYLLAVAGEMITVEQPLFMKAAKFIKSIR